MTLDQIDVLCEANDADGRGVVHKTPSELASLGVISPEGGSLCQMIERELKERQSQERRAGKLERRRLLEESRKC